MTTTHDALSGLPDVPAERLADLCRRRGIRELAVFGSRARGDARPDSDLDLLIEFEPTAVVGLLGYGEIEEELSELFGLKVDLVSKPGLKRLLRDRVLRERIVLHAQ